MCEDMQGTGTCRGQGQVWSSDLAGQWALSLALPPVSDPRDRMGVCVALLAAARNIPRVTQCTRLTSSLCSACPMAVASQPRPTTLVQGTWARAWGSAPLRVPSPHPPGPSDSGSRYPQCRCVWGGLNPQSRAGFVETGRPACCEGRRRGGRVWGAHTAASARTLVSSHLEL